MSKHLKKLLALILALAMITTMFPAVMAAEHFIEDEMDLDKPYVYTQADFDELQTDVFASIENIKVEAAQKMGGIGVMKEADYASLIPQVIRAVESSSTYAKGTLEQHGNYLYWQTVKGIACCYDPRMEAEMNNTEDAPSAEEIARVEADAAAMLQPPKRGGTPTSINVGLIQPYWESSSSYSDSSFLNYSPYYKTTWQNLYGATGGQGIRYSMTNVTVNTVASTMEQCGLVIFDSHGTTDYSGSNSDYTSRANSSYLCINSTSGLTSTDTATKTGSYGSYSDAVVSGSSAFINGTAIANHMSGNAPHSMLYMGICLGMATDKMFSGLRAKDVNTVYGYSQSVSFKGELQSIQSIMAYIQDDMQAGAAVEQSQTDLGCQWDPAYSSYTESSAKSNKVAFPVVVSDEDTYLGHGNVDCVQTAHSEWHLFGTQYTVTATSNNTSWGTVSVNGTTITATPKTGYYAAGYTVTSGTATVVQNGNTFSVTPTSDCTVRINFAAKTAATVTYVANGTTVSTVNTYVGDSVTLPAAQANVDDWSFEGWIPGTLAETSDKPTYYKANTAYTVPSASVTMYALYTRLEASGSGEVVYQLADGIESGSKYILVDETSVSGTTGYAVGNAIVSNSHYLNAVAATINDDLCTVASSSLASVVWQVASSGSGYTFYNAAAGKYIGLDSSEYVYPSSTPLAWAYTSEGYLDNQSDSEGYYYLSFDTTNIRYTTNKSGKVIRLYKETNAGTTYYTTEPVTAAHEHTMEQIAAKSPTCTVAGNTAYYHCTTCNKYYSDANGENEITLASTVIAALGHNYVDVVTAPTETTQGYTTHTCSRCGDSYVDTYVPALGSDYPVHFSVPAGVTAPADMVSNTNTGITLPTAEAPEGYTFLGWVTEDYDNVETRPAAILTGNYIAPQEITLKALYTYTEGNGGVAYELLTAAPADWSGNYVITSNTTTVYVAKGVTPTSNGAVTEDNTNASAFAASGITQTDNLLTNVASDYVFTLAANGSYYTIQSVSTGTYYGMNSSSYLSGYTTLNTSYCRWTPAINASGIAQLKNAANGSYPYFSISGSNDYFWAGSSTNANVLKLWKEIEVGTSYYTTIIGEEHVHTPAAPVIENEVPATCTTAGSYDSVVYCSECGEEISRETVTVPALGHTAGTAVKENEVAATCTTAGSYDMVTYCTVCGAELSRETTTVPALGHNWSAWTSNNDGTHSRTCSVCNETETHDCEFGDDNVCDVCGYERSTEMDLFIGMTLSLEGATSVNYLVPKDALDAYGLDSFKMVVVHTDYDRDTGVYSEETRELAAEAELYVAGGANYYKFVYAEIPAMKLNDVMIAHVEGEKDGVTFTSAVLERNPIQYCYNTTNNAAAGENLQKTCANMILYAAAAQTLFNYNTANLATAAWTQTQEALCERDVPAWENIDSREPLESGKLVNIIGTTLDVNSRVDMRYVMSFEDGVDYTTLTMYCTYTTYQDDTVTVEIPGTTWTDYQGYKAATMDVLNAAEMRSLLTAVVKDANGNVVSETYHTNVQSYGCKIYNNASAPQNLKDLMVAMVNYGDAAEVLLKNK